MRFKKVFAGLLAGVIIGTGMFGGVYTPFGNAEALKVVEAAVPSKTVSVVKTFTYQAVTSSEAWKKAPNTVTYNSGGYYGELSKTSEIVSFTAQSGIVTIKIRYTGKVILVS